ncbi:MAG: hypothetical protein AB8B80_01150 [Marinicellaceae bacterium]
MLFSVFSYANLSEQNYGYDTSTPATTTCGGEGQEDCLGTAATFTRSANPDCPAGTRFNLFTWACYSCPEDYKLSFEGGFDPESERACSKRINRPSSTGTPIEQLINDIVNLTEQNTSPATLHGTACPAGSFFDPIRGGECWSCPSSHPKRSWDHIDTATACVSSTDMFDTHSATLVKENADCDDGQEVDFLQDVESGGRCFSCPETYVRTWEPVTSDKACGTPKNVEFAYSILEEELTCPSGENFDLINWQHDRVISKALNAQKLTGIELDSNNKDGGSCWTCPDMSAGRSGSAVYEPDACVAPDIRWTLPKWTSPGVYGRYPNHEAVSVVSELLTERNFINSIIDEVWNEDQKKYGSNKHFSDFTQEGLKSALWEEIYSRPQTSGILRLALKSVLLRQASGQGTGYLPPSSSAYLRAFESAITNYRVFLVQQSKNAFELWNARALERDVHKSNQTVGETLKKIGFSLAMLPWPPQSVPDFRSEAEDLTVDFQTSETAVKMAVINEIGLSETFRNRLIPFTYESPRESIKGPAYEAAQEIKANLEGEIQGKIEAKAEAALVRLSSRTVRSASSKAASVLLKVSKWVNVPLVIADVILTLDDVYVEVIIDRATMPKQYENQLQLMSQPYSLNEALMSNKGIGEFDLYFNVISHNDPNDNGFEKIVPSPSMVENLCGKGGKLSLQETGFMCNIGCPAKDTPMKLTNGFCDLGNAPKYVDNFFVTAPNPKYKNETSNPNSNYSCPAGTHMEYANDKGCMSCPLGYEKFGNWDETINKVTSSKGPYGECVFLVKESFINPKF